MDGYRHEFKREWLHPNPPYIGITTQLLSSIIKPLLPKKTNHSESINMRSKITQQQG